MRIQHGAPLLPLPLSFSPSLTPPTLVSSLPFSLSPSLSLSLARSLTQVLLEHGSVQNELTGGRGGSNRAEAAYASTVLYYAGPAGRPGMILADEARARPPHWSRRMQHMCMNIGIEG